ncbi:MAG: DUF3047 domain-containing protein [Rubrivivax sp.]|nr:DUF3047 domain-containing protein [Rubrivivax sp.]
MSHRLLLPLIALLLAGCASMAPDTPRPTVDPLQWHAVALPGKNPTLYARSSKDGRPAWSARSERSASMWRRKLAPGAPGEVSFSWWVDSPIHGASVADVDREDAPARVIFAFAGDVRQLPARTRMKFELAEALTGEAPPYATLMYVWESKDAAAGTVIINPRSDRIRKIVLDAGSHNLRRWRDHRRDLAADFRLAFGEEPGALLAVAKMTDTDNTGSTAETWYGPVVLH